MQLPQLFRRGIVLACDEASEEMLHTWFVTEPIMVHFMPIAGDGVFENIWRCGVFQAINTACGTLIDDSEEEILDPRFAQEAHKAVTAIRYLDETDAGKKFRSCLLWMLTTAARESRHVWFIL